MNLKRKINYSILVICLVIAILVLVEMGWEQGFTWAAIAVLVGLIHVVLPEGSGVLYMEEETSEFF